jgi:streptogramin lyase
MSTTSNGFSGGLHAADIAVQPDGAVYVASGGDTFFYRYSATKSSISLISPTGAVTLLAGSDPIIGMADGPALAASFDRPLGIAVGPRGEVIIADTGNSAIRQLDPGHLRVTTLAGGVGRGNRDGPAAGALFHDPQGIAAAPDGSLFVADSGNLAVRQIAPDGTVSSVNPLSAGGDRLVLRGLVGLAVDRQGTVFVAGDGPLSPIGASWLASISPAGVSTALYTGPIGRLAIAVDAASNLYACDAYGLQVFAPGSAGRRLGSAPAAVALAAAGAGVVYAASAYAVVAVDALGNVKPVAGHAGEPGYRDGAAADSRFSMISALALDPAGNLYIADASLTIRRLTADGMVRTIAGRPGQAGPATGPAPGVLGAVKGMTWFANALYLTVGNAVLKLTFQE